ncbi:hypothetical protein GMB51_11240 [Turicibacter sanguinis]|nr:hypothetical protein [Turicibacter sanguinis]MTN51522.1 hypothetical protein [Turicibacter sanguinis]MTN54720.1 hypothetical protein [Turicibacter sanguinis]MTN57803.1 hypothetical protein [Turicibacter sanguinis]MTN60918.1 hypothetical protein [Turicibacter sanguinis]
MDKSSIIQIAMVVCGVGVIIAGVLFFFSFDPFMKDIDRRINEEDKKVAKKKK